jgi:hypothetical protein
MVAKFTVNITVTTNRGATMLNMEAFKKLIEVLEIVEAQKKPFNLATTIDHEPICGTVACAFGWMAVMRAWPGLSVRTDPEDGEQTITYNGQEGFGMPLHDVFMTIPQEDLTDHESDVLTFIFYPGSWWPNRSTWCPTNVREVIDRVKLFIELGPEEFVKRINYERSER